MGDLPVAVAEEPLVVLSPRRGRRPVRVALLTVPIAVAGLVSAVAAPASADPPATPGAPGSMSYFDLARKDCVGTARNDTSKVWFTVADGVLSDVYEPTIDNTNVQTMQYVVTDGSSFTDLAQRDDTYTAHADPSGMSCTVVTHNAAHHYRLVSTYFTDPGSDAVMVRTHLLGQTAGLHVYVRLDAHVNGNGGGGSDNAGADTGAISKPGLPVVGDTSTVSAAANRDYAVPTWMALGSPTIGQASVGYAGSESDGLTQLDTARRLTPVYTSAPDGHVVATADVTPARSNPAISLALGFGRTRGEAVKVAQTSSALNYHRTLRSYLGGWSAYDKTLTPPFAKGRKHNPAYAADYYLSANVLKASVDKTFPGAVAASLSSPWGQAVPAGVLSGGKPVYFGSYREVFARDLYEAVTGFLADGDTAEARAATLFLFDRQQEADGRMPRNSLLNGKVAPDTGGDQLDETAYPILMTWLTGMGNRAGLYKQHVVKAADFLVSHGPSFGVERWEEQSGYSPSTIAAEIAGLTAAASIAREQGDNARARIYQATADDFQRTVKSLTVTSDGPLSDQPYFLRLTKNGDPNSDYTYNLGNGSVDADQKSVVDGGFQDLVRLGELSPTDPDVENSLKVLDATISAQTPTGTGYYRYGTDGAGSEDGYGDCWTADPTDCPKDGQPWPTTDKGSGHLWPVLSGERAETALAEGQGGLARSQLKFMLQSAAGEGLVPEQVWEDQDVAADPYGTDPTTASIGFTDGHPAGSASPLTWAQAQEVRLIRDIGAGTIVDRPSITTKRYVTHTPPGNVPTTIDTPAANATVEGTTTVAGTTAPGAKVDVSSWATETGSAKVYSTTADSAGAYSVDVATGFGSDVITVSATKGGDTGYAQVAVSGDLVGGATVLDVTDPSGDDNGPGTYQYPTASDFKPGAFDLTRFEVLTKGSHVFLRATLGDLTPTFGDPLGAQLFDIYVHDPSATTTSTAAAYASRNYQIADADAWSQRITVRGFASPEWVDASGNTVGTVSSVVESQAAKTVTIELPQAQFGDPSSGWSFAVALTGQDGYGHDGARDFTANPGGYTFGVCASGDTSPICSVDPSTVPRVLDTIVPDGVTQDAELDPTSGTPTLHGVTVP